MSLRREVNTSAVQPAVATLCLLEHFWVKLMHDQSLQQVQYQVATDSIYSLSLSTEYPQNVR